MAGAAMAAMLPGRAGDSATALAATVDSLEGVPEALHGFYLEKDGKFNLQVAGLPTQENVTRLEGALTKERNDHKATKESLNKITHNGQRQVDDIIADLDRIPELEATQGTIDETKVNELVEARIKARIGPVERERDKFKKESEDKDVTINDFQSKERTRTIHDKVREDAVKAKLLPEAVEDALLLADRVFEIDDSGRVVTKDNVGVTPGLEPAAWLTDLQPKRPHWWGPSTGGGAGGNRGGGGGGGENPFTHDGWNLTAQGALVQSDRAKAEQLAKAAGTTIGGQRPPKK
jgi:hypothetical protein